MFNNEFKNEYELTLTVKTNFGYESEQGMDITENVERMFISAFNDLVHDYISSEELKFRVIEKLNHMAGINDIEEMNDLGALQIKISKLEEKPTPTEAMIEDFKFLYQEYYLEDDEELTDDAKEIKRKLSKILEENNHR